MRVRFWTPNTGLRPQYGTVCTFRDTEFGEKEAEIIPDAGGNHVYLFRSAVWCYEPIEEDSMSHFDDDAS